MLLNNLYDKLPWRTKIYGIGIYGVSCSPSMVVSVVRSVVAVVVCFSVAEAVSVDRSVVVAAVVVVAVVVVGCSVAEVVSGSFVVVAVVVCSKFSTVPAISTRHFSSACSFVIRCSGSS